MLIKRNSSYLTSNSPSAYDRREDIPQMDDSIREAAGTEALTTPVPGGLAIPGNSHPQPHNSLLGFYSDRLVKYEMT